MFFQNYLLGKWNLFRLCYRIFIPDSYLLPVPNWLSRNPKCWVQWILNYLYAFFSVFVMDPLLNFFALYLGGRRNFGRALVLIVLLYLIWFITVLYLCLIPRRMLLWRWCSQTVGCNSAVEGYWIVIHLVCSHWFLFVIFYHYLSAVFKHPGQVPGVLPPDLHSVTICPRCPMPRPMRAHHCGICGGCILRMDHHCPWIANCVGLRTHVHFYLSLTLMSTGGLYLLAVGRPEYGKHLLELDKNHFSVDVSKISEINPQPTFLHTDRFPCQRFVHHAFHIGFVFGLVAIPLVIILWAWQTYLISRGETSIEYHTNKRYAWRLQRRGLIFLNPHDFGLWNNWIRFLGLYDLCTSSPSPYSKMTKVRIVLFWRLFLRLFIPFYPVIYGDGLHYDLNVPTVESVLSSLSAIDSE
ncbi:unnamed protein product [Calicophoron daubneyi]|uniref:Palmitoyltransferase n=1 Tax=Calicophoron daubneyi TaxID=300641 RepID=A0AAV2TQR8_CALDB